MYVNLSDDIVNPPKIRIASKNNMSYFFPGNQPSQQAGTDKPACASYKINSLLIHRLNILLKYLYAT